MIFSWGFLGGSDDKESACNAGDLGSIPGSGRSPEQGKKPGLKLTFRKMKIMASGPVTSWQINGETTEIATDFIYLVFKITVDDDCSHEIERCLLIGRKAMTNIDSILKSRDISWPTKVCIVEAMVFPVVIYGCESRTIKKAEH